MKKILFAAILLLGVFAASPSAACSGSCTYYPSGNPVMLSWSASCSGGALFNHVSANALVGSTGYPCTPGDSFGSSTYVMCSGATTGQMQWRTSQGTITSASIQVVDNNNGVAFVSCTAGGTAPPQPPPPQPQPPQPQPPGPQPPQPQPPGPQPPAPTTCPPTTCSSFTVTRASSSNPLAGRSFNANCVMNVCGSNSYGCPTDPQWTASYGSISPASGGSTYWTQSGTSTVTISASVPACGTAQLDYDPATCTMSSVRPIYWTPAQQTDLSAGAYTNPATGREFQALCADQYGETFACPGPISWTSNAGSFTTSPYHASADYTYWLASGNPSSPVTITATSPTCGSTSASYALPVCSTVALNPRPIPLATPEPDLTRTSPIPGENLEFNLQCNDQYGERYLCPAAPTWTIQSGILTDASHDATTDTYVQAWNASSVYGPFDFSATVAGCGSGQYSYRPPAVCADIDLSYGPTTTEDFALSPGYTSTGSQFQWSPNGLENYMQALPGKFWGYNWTIEWRDRPTPDWVPYRIFGAACTDQYGQGIQCPSPTWNATSGYFETTSSSQIPNRFGLPANAVVWRSGNATERTNVTAIVPYCAANNLSFDLYVHNACRVIPDPANVIDLCTQYPWIQNDPRLRTVCTLPMVRIPNGGASNFTALCRDDAGQWLNCLEPNFAWVDSNTTATATSTQYWRGYQYYNETGDMLWRWNPSFMGNSVVTVTANESDTFGMLTAGGPTHNCKAGIIIGNPALACDLSVSNDTPQVGQTVQATLSCRGLDGVVPCPDDLELFSGPGLLFQPTSSTTADITPVLSGRQNLTARNFDPQDPKDRSPIPISCRAVLNVSPSLNRCNLLPRISKFSTGSTDFAAVLDQLGHLEAVPNLVLIQPDARLQYASDVFACGQNFDDGIRSAPGFLAVDSTRLHENFTHPAVPVTITLSNLPYTQTPTLYVLDGFAPDAQTVIQNGRDCVTANRCQNVQYDAQTHTLSFQTNGFSSYATTENSKRSEENPPLPASVRFILDCPLPQLGQNLTRASAFLYLNGTPAADPSMVLAYDLNESYGFDAYPVLVNPATGRHDFIIDTRFGGTYHLQAESGNWTSNACSLDVFEQESNPIPELSEWLILAVFLAAGLIATRKKQ